jgi:hypothetical protein
MTPLPLSYWIKVERLPTPQKFHWIDLDSMFNDLRRLMLNHGRIEWMQQI